MKRQRLQSLEKQAQKMNKYLTFWKEFERLCSNTSHDNERNQEITGIIEQLIENNKINCGIKINPMPGIRNNKFYEERHKQKEIILTLMENSHTDVDEYKENIIEILYSTFNNLFPKNHPLRKWWSIIKYIPRIPMSIFPLPSNADNRAEDSKIFFHPITTEYGMFDLIIFVEDGIKNKLLKERINKGDRQIFLGHESIKILIIKIIGEYMFMNYINNMEFYPNILFDEVPKIPIKKLYEVIMKQLNLSNMFTKCNRCLLNNYNVDLNITSDSKMYCDEICYNI